MRYKRAFNKLKKKYEYLHRAKTGADGYNTVVHHKDGDKHNNNKNNLKIMSRSEHTGIENTKLKTQYTTCTIKGCKRPHHAKGLCKSHYLTKLIYSKYGRD